ncbi:acyltransferase [Aulographum hederae CBS 113979]|uniref:Acyltransferase n=1 Tax=Aulographum hederae CBS 113979 TaxID=1176131 RepID=A0A6G1GZ14_9PEZI|nr:acyltransferase [Aulographum hederae CBS 113979]
MSSDTLRQRVPDKVKKPEIDLGAGATSKPPPEEHPSGPIKHGGSTQAYRAASLLLYFAITTVSVHVCQFIGAPLYFYDQDWYYAWMALSKRFFGLIVTTITQWWSPTVIRISGDASVRGQLKQAEDGRLICDFPERMVLVANHQIYTDWLYLWWTAYTSRMHGHIYIILKESLKWVPILGPGMQFFSFIFLSRKWATDRPRFQHRLRKLSQRHGGAAMGLTGTPGELDPMWLLIFPEGTNLSDNGRVKSGQWAEKTGIEDLKHALLPRATGLLFCLQELRETVDWVYDCTIAYEGVGRGQFAQDLFTIRSTYLQGRPPKSVNMHWRRFAVSSIPLDDVAEFEKWLDERWREKDALLELYVETGRFPADEGEVVTLNGHGNGGEKKEQRKYIETAVGTNNPFEILQVYVPFATLGLVLHLLRKLWIATMGAIFFWR